MIIIRCIMVIIALSIPFFVGLNLNRESIEGSYLYGQFVLWALFQVIAVPMVQLRLPFTSLFIVFVCCVAVMAVIGAKRFPEFRKAYYRPAVSPVLILAVILIIYQMTMYAFGQHLDEDDARWIAEANDALAKGRMYLDNPATGEYIGAFRGEMTKDVFSPWAMYIACFARYTFLRPAVITHTVYAPVLLCMMYVVYYEISKLLFKGKTEQDLFVLAVAVINLFFNGNVYTQSVFSIVRIWQGKAVVGAVIIPAILMIFLLIQKQNIWKNWLLLALTGCDACLFSGMGIAISLIMIGVYGLYAVIYGKGRYVGLWVLAMLPSIAYGLFYYIMRG